MVALSVGCLSRNQFNPDFPMADDAIREERRRMREEPARLERPVIVLSGYRSPGLVVARLANRLRELTGAEHDQIVTLSYMTCGTIEEPARRAVRLVESRFPSDDPEWTTEVDVVAISMGGLVARLASADPALRDEAGGKRLKIKTLYTLASPHGGAKLANRIHFDRATRCMIPGSMFLSVLDASLESCEYEVVPYAVLNDTWVGARNASPPGQDAIWTPGRYVLSHHLVSLDARIQTDIARRLRGEEPLAKPGPVPSD